MIDVSIIIVNWNTRDLLAQCLESVISSQSPVISDQLSVVSRKADLVADDWLLTTEVFVVDNASTDGSATMVRERFPQVRLIENDENVGFAKANNQGLRQAAARYVMLLNPDTRVLGRALETLVGFMDTHPDVGAAGARLFNPDGTLQPSCHPMPTLFREFWRLFHLDRIVRLSQYDMNRWDIHQPHCVEAVQGACMIARWTALNQTGLLDENYFMYTEEVDLCYRLAQAGWAIYWVPKAQVIHYGGQSTQQVATDMFLRLYESKILFFRKHGGSFAAWAYKVILAAAAIARIVPGSLARLLAPAACERLAAKGRLYRQLLTTLPTF